MGTTRICAGRGCAAITGALLLIASSAAIAGSGAVDSEEITIDFEGFAEYTRIGDQYEHLGVTFELGGVDGLPIIAREGPPGVAFGGYDGSHDTPFVSGVAGLTDPPGNLIIDSVDMVIRFAKPVAYVRLWVIDIDGGGTEHWTDRCTLVGADATGIVIDTMTFDANDPGTGDLAHTLFELVAPEGSAGISKVAIDVSDDMGYAIDDVTFRFMPEDDGPDDGPDTGGGDDDGGDDDDGDDDDDSGGGGGGTPGVIHKTMPIGQENFFNRFVFGHGRAIITSEPDGGVVYAEVPYHEGEFTVDAHLLPCNTATHWSIVGVGPRGNTVRMGSKLHPIERRLFADIAPDGVVDTADLGLLIDAFINGDPIGDLNDDGVVDTADIGLLLREFGTTCDD